MLKQNDSDETLLGFDSYELTLGDKMRGERATLGKSLADISDELKLREDILQAVEDCNLDGFPSPSFIAGYVRSYAEHLGLPPEECFIQFCEESGFSGLQSQFADEKRKRSDHRKNATHLDQTFLNPYLGKKPLNYGLMSRISGNMVASLLTVALFLGGLGYLGYTVIQEIQRVSFAPVETAVNNVEAPDALNLETSEATLKQPELSGEEKDAKLAELYRPTSLETPILTPRVGPISNIDPNTLGIFASTTQDTETPNAPVATVQETNEVVVFAAAPAWVRVYATDGAVLFEKILDKGQSYKVSEQSDLILRAGNSGAVYFAIDGQYFGPAGTGGSVVDQVALTAKDVKSNYAQTDQFADLELAPPLNSELASVD